MQSAYNNYVYLSTVDSNGVTTTVNRINYSWNSNARTGINLFSFQDASSTEVTFYFSTSYPMTDVTLMVYTLCPQDSFELWTSATYTNDVYTQTSVNYQSVGSAILAFGMSSSEFSTFNNYSASYMTYTPTYFLSDLSIDPVFITTACLSVETSPNNYGYINYGVAGANVIAQRMLGVMVYSPQYTTKGSVLDMLRVADPPIGNMKQPKSAADTFRFSDFARDTLPQYLTDAMSDAISIDNTYVLKQYWNLVQTIGLNEQYTSRQFASIVEEPWFEDYFDLAFTAVAVDALSVSEVLAYAYRLGPTVLEKLGIGDSANPKFNFIALVAERVASSDAVVIAVPITVAENLQVAYALTVVRASRIIEQLRLTDALAPKQMLNTGFGETFQLTDALRRFFGGDVVDAVGVTEQLSRSKRAYPVGADTIGVADTTTRKLVLRTIADESIKLTHTEVLKLLFKPALQEHVEIAAAYVSPGNSVTTWAVNTKNMAVTEYTGYEFNSFAQVGNKYLGASSNGLYELNGDTDAGTNIVAQIKSGFAQFAGSRFTSFKAAYLGMHGSGEFVLKVEAGDGKTFVYKVLGKDMETTKVHFGKGLRARYFAFELISTGQDFDLDDIEFVPLMAQRRV